MTLSTQTLTSDMEEQTRLPDFLFCALLFQY